MKNKNESVGASLGKAVHDLCYLLTLVFCALRACDVITWKWYWVLSPIFASEIIGIIALLIAGAVAIKVVNEKDT